MLPEPDGMPPHVSPSIYIYPSIEGRDGHPQLPPPPPPLPRRHGGGAEAAWAAVWRAVRLEEPSCAIGDAVAPPARCYPNPMACCGSRDGHPQHLHHCRGRHGGGAEAAWAAVWRAVRLEEPSCAIGDAVAPPAMLPEPDGMLRLPQGAC